MNISFALDENSGQLIAEYEKLSATELTRDILLEHLKEAGFEHAFLLEDNIEGFLKKAKQGGKKIKLPVAEIKDGETSLLISDDDMRAYLTITPAFGGKAITKEDVTALLKEHKVTFGINKELIDEILEQGECDRIEIAHGTYPSEKQESAFESLVPEAVFKNPEEDESGRVDYMSSYAEYIVVEPGTPLMRRMPPKDKKDGHDIYGRVIKAPPVKVVNFSSRCRGAIVSPDDENLLIAEIKGHPVVFENGVTVDPTLVLPTVNLASGNVDYDGSLIVKGDVASQMSIKVTGDVNIEGIVNAATIEAGGNVICKQGIIGGASRSRVDEEVPEKKGANIFAKGKVAAAFIDNAHIHAEGDICAREYICHSILESKNSILVGSGGKGNIFGGHLCARGGLRVRVLGSQAYVKTDATVGVDPDILEAYQTYTAQIKEIDFELVEVKMLIRQLENPQNDLSKMAKLEKVARLKSEAIEKIDILHDRLSELVKLQSEIQEDVEAGKDSKVTVIEKAYPGTTINILNKSWVVTEEPAAGVYSIENERMVKNSLKPHDRTFPK